MLRGRIRAKQSTLALQTLNPGPLPPQNLEAVHPVSTASCRRQLLRQAAQLELPGAMSSSCTTILVVHGCEREPLLRLLRRLLPSCDSNVSCDFCRISTVILGVDDWASGPELRYGRRPGTSAGSREVLSDNPRKHSRPRGRYLPFCPRSVRVSLHSPLHIIALSK